MKKIVVAVLAAGLLMTSLTGCVETAEQKQRRLDSSLEAAKQTAERASAEYDHLMDMLDEYDRAQAYLDSFK